MSVPDTCRGRDSFGPFFVGTAGVNASKDQCCSYCHAPVNYAIIYAQGKGFHLFTYKGVELKPKDTILRKRSNPLGIDCGCYAKLHRQVCHITSRERNK